MRAGKRSFFSRLIGRLVRQSVPIDGALCCDSGDASQARRSPAAQAKPERQDSRAVDLDARQLNGFPRNGANFR